VSIDVQELGHNKLVVCMAFIPKRNDGLVICTAFIPKHNNGLIIHTAFIPQHNDDLVVCPAFLMKCRGGLGLGMSCLDKLPDLRDENGSQWFYYMHTRGTSSISRKKGKPSIMRDLPIWLMAKRLVLSIELVDSVNAVKSTGTMDGTIKSYKFLLYLTSQFEHIHSKHFAYNCII